ncbi:hypothetical protein [Streptomyces graminilatus]|uniref:hypothetical protein n=1 Tax=Streptomyces graminilatus TaxID=1464070 RepID=UPI000B0B0101|nr:hypothetical protein [Streptomyces graminilatus]
MSSSNSSNSSNSSDSSDSSDSSEAGGRPEPYVRPEPYARPEPYVRPEPPVNNGLVINGGTHYVGNQAIGHGAQAFSGSVGFEPRDDEQIAARMSELLLYVEQLLTEHREALADPEATTRELRRLREELDEDQPEPTVLRRALDRLTAFAQPVTPLVVAVGELTQSVRGALGV